MSAQSPIRIQKYVAASQEAALQAFAADSSDAAAAGYEPVGQTWEGTTLLVTYRFVGTSAARHEPAGQQRELLIPAGALVAGGVLVAVGSVLPWITAIGGFGITVSRSGVEGGDGLITVILGVAIGLFGLTMLRGRNLDRWRLAFLTSAATLVLIGFDYLLIEQRVKDVNRGDNVFASVGLGIWTVGIGALIATYSSWRIRDEARMEADRIRSTPPSYR